MTSWDLSKECGVVIPCLNESARIGAVVREVRALVPITVVIDDGSSDATAECACAEGAMVLSHARTQGKGAALRTGMRWLSEQNLAWAITMDGDGQHVPGDIPAMWRCAASTGAALVVGNRMDRKSPMPLLRRLVNGWMSRRLSSLARQRLPDTQCGYRLVNLGVWFSLAMETEHFEIESESLLRFIAAGHRVEFVPIQVIYADESSKIRPLQDTLRWLGWWRRARRRSRGHAAARAPRSSGGAPCL